eukprot:1194823-Prorocentrum_minimum.AAC.1
MWHLKGFTDDSRLRHFFIVRKYWGVRLNSPVVESLNKGLVSAPSLALETARATTTATPAKAAALIANMLEPAPTLRSQGTLGQCWSTLAWCQGTQVHSQAWLAYPCLMHLRFCSETTLGADK